MLRPLALLAVTCLAAPGIAGAQIDMDAASPAFLPSRAFRLGIRTAF